MSDDGDTGVRLAADVAILTVLDGRFAVLLIKRANPPFEGRLALPGGFLESGETLARAAERELHEETGLSDRGGRLEQVGVYSDPGRDPRGRVVAVSYVAMVPGSPGASAGGDAADALWVPVEDALDDPGELAFDHWKILADAAEHARRRLEYSTVATSFCPEEFTVAELRRVYEVIWDTALDPGNFHRKVTRLDGFLEPVGRSTARDGGRPAALFRAGPLRRLPLPIGRP